MTGIDDIPWGDPISLVGWVEQESDGISNEPNDWLLLINGSIHRMRVSDSPRDRRKYRDAAVTAAAKAHQKTSGRRFTRWLELGIRARVIYVGRGEEGAEWDVQEAESIYDDFIASTGMDAKGLSECLSGVREFPFEADSSSMSALGNAIIGMEKLIPLLPAEKRSDLDQWILLRERLIHWRRPPHRE